jgi:uncharacterized DUF497 family protein
LQGLKFEWDSAKAAANRRKHRVSFEEARTVFTDPNAYFENDDTHSGFEVRIKAIGFSERPRLLTVIFTRRDETTRIISARKTTAAEEAAYAQKLD